jgi:hypothetical protein
VTYSVSKAEGITGGTVSFSPGSGPAGITVTITVTPDEQYTLKNGSVTVVKTGDPAETVSVGGGGNTWTFILPAFDVTVSAEFEFVPENNKVITVSIPTAHGIVGTAVAGSTASSSAVPGVSVTLTVTPESGYKLKSGFPRVIKTGDTSAVPEDVAPGTVDPNTGAGTYTFTMPGYPVTVTAEFEGSPKSVKITGFTDPYTGEWNIILLPTQTSGMNDMVAVAWVTPSGNVLSGPLVAISGETQPSDPWIESGSYYIYLVPRHGDDHPDVARYISKEKVSFTGTVTEIAFSADTFDTASGLPSIAFWARTITGGTAGEVSVQATAVDTSGNIYIAGDQTGVFDYGKGNIGTAGVRLAFLVKYNSAGTVQWAKTYGSSKSKFNALAVGNGGIYVTGTLDDKACLAKCDPGTGAITWSKPADATSSHFNGVAVSGTNIYVAGNQNGNSVGYGDSVTITITGGSMAILVKYVDTGSSATTTWATKASGESAESEFGAVAVDATGIYAVGVQQGTLNYGNDKSATGGFATGDNAVIVRYQDNGDTVITVWANSVSGGDDSAFGALTVNSTGIYAAGAQAGTKTYTYQGGSGATATGNANGKDNAVIVKYNAEGNAQWAKTATAPSSGDVGSMFMGLAADSSGIYAAGMQIGNGTYNYGNSIYITGAFSGAGEDPANAVLVKYDSNGSALAAKSVITGPNTSWFSAIAAGPSDRVYAAGMQMGTGTFVYDGGQSATGTNPGDDGDDGFNPVLVEFPK